MAQTSPFFLPWWDPTDSPESLCTSIEATRQRLEGHPGLSLFRKRSLMGFVLMANRLEQTLPAGFDELATFRVLEAQADSTVDCDAEFAAPPQHFWSAEGGSGSAATKQQLLQFTKAAQFLCCPLRLPLTTSDICTAHKLMMWGATEGNVLLAAGEYRVTPAFSGTGYVYPEPSSIAPQLERIVDDFNAKLRSGQVRSHVLAADLLYQFVTLHPFVNGNGRMCRLLAAYAAMAAGEPFLTHLSNGHSRTRQHYQQSLRHADKHEGNTGRLQNYILDCLHLQWQNAVAYTGSRGPTC